MFMRIWRIPNKVVWKCKKATSIVSLCPKQIDQNAKSFFFLQIFEYEFDFVVVVVVWQFKIWLLEKREGRISRYLSKYLKFVIKILLSLNHFILSHWSNQYLANSYFKLFFVIFDYIHSMKTLVWQKLTLLFIFWSELCFILFCVQITSLCLSTIRLILFEASYLLCDLTQFGLFVKQWWSHRRGWIVFFSLSGMLRIHKRPSINDVTLWEGMWFCDESTWRWGWGQKTCLTSFMDIPFVWFCLPLSES